ncbi:hypothetical protein ACNKHS_09545 [Shigella flexneri]
MKWGERERWQHRIYFNAGHDYAFLPISLFAVLKKLRWAWHTHCGKVFAFYSITLFSVMLLDETLTRRNCWADNPARRYRAD